MHEAALAIMAVVLTYQQVACAVSALARSGVAKLKGVSPRWTQSMGLAAIQLQLACHYGGTTH